MFKYLGVFCMCFLLSGVRGNFLDDLKHFGDQALHSALDSLSTDGVKTLVSTAVSAAGTGEQIIPTTIIWKIVCWKFLFFTMNKIVVLYSIVQVKNKYSYP